MESKHAVLYADDGCTYLHAPGVYLPHLALSSVNAFADIALEQGITAVWVMPSAPTIEKGYTGGAWSIQENHRHGKLATISVYKRGQKHNHLNIIYPAHTAWSTIFDGAAPKEIMGAATYLERALGVPITGSPTTAGWAYLKKLHPEWIENIPVDLREMHFTAHAGTDIIWQRPLTQGETECVYLHKFDKSGAYPYAATQTDIGVGTPVHVDHGLDAVHEKGHPQEVGVWRCTIACNPDPEAYNTLLPPPWNEQKGVAWVGWLAGPIIRLLRATGHIVTIMEGYVFPQRHDLLMQWANNLWNIRQGFDDLTRWPGARSARLAQKGTKQIMNSTIGYTAFKGFDEDEEEKRRPDIRLQVVARNRELVWHNLFKTSRLDGQTPIMVYIDAAYYISNERNGRAALPSLVRREGQFGGFRWEGCIEMDAAILEMFRAKMPVAQRLTYLNQRGGMV